MQKYGLFDETDYVRRLGLTLLDSLEAVLTILCDPYFIEIVFDFFYTLDSARA